jgi:4-hydroxy-3-polyprenylbenzoate decarboxylase
MSEIASGIANTLITRAADVTLKERRKLILMVRETPLHLGHLRAMTAVTEIGAIVAPPMPAFYSRPETVDDLINHNIFRVLDLFGLDCSALKRWGRDVGLIAQS